MSKRDEKNERLDLTSSKFDASKALLVPDNKVKSLIRDAPLYDNITWFVETENGIFPRERIKKPTKPSSQTSATSVPLSQNVTKPKESTNNRTKYKNVLTRMDNAVGPISFLKKCMDEKLRVKVFIRSVASIRGFCLGFVEAFDKHMNMVLKDVFETWKRPRRKHGKVIEPVMTTDGGRCENLSEEESYSVTTSNFTTLHKHGEKALKSNNTEDACYRIPRWVVKRRLKKKDVCERHVDQLMIRGEQVVTVMLEQYCTLG